MRDEKCYKSFSVSSFLVLNINSILFKVVFYCFPHQVSIPLLKKKNIELLLSAKYLS